MSQMIFVLLMCLVYTEGVYHFSFRNLKRYGKVSMIDLWGKQVLGGNVKKKKEVVSLYNQ